MKKVSILLFALIPIFGYTSDLNTNIVHLNSRLELNVHPGTQLELGKSMTSKSALYLGFLLPNPDRPLFDVEVDMTYVFSRMDYFFNGAFEKGFYLGGLISYTQAEFSEADVRDKVSGAGIAAQVGYVWNISKVTIGASLKAHHYLYDRFQSIETDNSTSNFQLPHHHWLAGSLDIGYKF